jgi:RimJ/RimL family protein N-acetyltransferase
VFHPSEQFDIPKMAAFMRQPEIYGALTDALAPDPERVQFETYMLEPTTWTVACMWEEHIIGYVQLISRTSVAVELISGFHAQARGIIAKRFVEYVIQKAFKERGVLVVWAMIPSDNLPARHGIVACGFHQAARLHRAMIRIPKTYRGVTKSPGLYDLIVYALYRDKGN